MTLDRADTFERVLGLMDPLRLEPLFRQLMNQTLDLAEWGMPVALDGKAQTHSSLHTVTAFATRSGVSLASRDTGNGKGNELATMIDLVQNLKLEGCGKPLSKRVDHLPGTPQALVFNTIRTDAKKFIMGGWGFP